MLWTDKILVSSKDIENVDGNSCIVSSTLPIDGLGGVAHRAMEDVGQEIRRMAADYGYMSGYGSDFSASHLAAVNDVGGGRASVTKSFALPQVISHDPSGVGDSALKNWCLMAALYRLYRSQSSREGEDAYKAKKVTYAEDLRKAKEVVFGVGIPVVYSPLHRPAAELIHDSGTFDSTAISVVASPGAAGGNFDVCVSYVSSGGVESALSEPLSKIVMADEALSVDISQLNPPKGSVDSFWSTDGLSSQIEASGWNVYCRALGTKTFYLQNVSGPIDIETISYDFSGDPAFTGKVGKLGQSPDTLYLPQRTVFRS